MAELKKIPDHATLVFEGFMHDVYQWQQEMFDGSLAIFEAIRRRDSVTILAVADEKIIVNHEEQPYHTPFIALPGGMMEKGAAPLENAKRELLEETGYASSDWLPWFTADPTKSNKIEWNNHFFIARNCTKIADQKLDNGEKIITRLYTLDELAELRHDARFRNRELIPILEEISADEQKKAELKKLLFEGGK